MKNLLHKPKRNLNRLKDSYLRRVKSKRLAIKSTVFTFKMYFILHGVLFIAFLGILMASDNEEQAGTVGLVVFLSLLMPGIIYMIWNDSKDDFNDQVEDTMRNSMLTDKDDYQELYSVCNEILAEMGLSEKNVEIRYARNNSYFPSILEKDSIHCLIVPRNFITLFYQHRGPAKALLYHEFAHINQNDSNDFLLNGIVVANLKVLALVITGIMFVIMLFGNVAVSMVAILLLSTYVSVKQARLESENLADVSAVIHGCGGELIAVLKRFGLSDQPRRTTHFDPTVRIKTIERLMKKFNIPFSMTAIASFSSTSPRKETGNGIIPDEKYNAMVMELHNLIPRAKKEFFHRRNTSKVEDIIEKMVTSKSEGIWLLKQYAEIFGSDLIEDIKAIQGSYDSMKRTLSPFIRHGVVAPSFPHERVVEAYAHGSLDLSRSKRFADKE